jgi:EmrB/QacA subfamily drug resistance transporter
MPSNEDSAHRLRWVILLALLIGTATGALGNSLVNVALPTIMDHFAVDVTTGTWSVTVYILFFAVTMPLFGRLGDMYGYKRAYLIGMSVFALSSLAASFAQSYPLLILLRAIQGVGNGPILPAIMAVVGTLFPPGERGRAMGVWALVNSAFHAIGPPLSGFLTQYLGWQSIFLSYVPLCVLALVLVWRLMPNDNKYRRQPFDVVGALTLTAATLTLMFNLRQGASIGWTSPISLALWALCAGLMAAFLVTENRVAQPFVDLDLFRNRPLSAAAVIAFVQVFSQFGLLFLIPLFLIDVQGYQAARTGLILSSLPIAMALSAPVAGRLADRYGCRLLCVSGMAVTALSGLGLSLLGPTTPLWHIVAFLSLTGVSMGMVQSPAPAAISLVVPPQKLGIAMGLFNLMRFIGGALGPTIFAFVLQSADAGSLTGAFRMDFYLVSLTAIVAVLVGIFVPGAEAPHACPAGERSLR